MENDLQRTYQKSSKQSRKYKKKLYKLSKFDEAPSQLSNRSEIHVEQGSNNQDRDCLNEIIVGLTSDIDDQQSSATPSILSTKLATDNDQAVSFSIEKNQLTVHPLQTSNLTRKRSSKSSKKERRSDQYGEKTYTSSKSLNSTDVNYDSAVPRKSIDDQRRDRLTKYLKDFYQDYFEFDRNLNINYIHDDLNNNCKRKQYSNALWYELKAFFNGTSRLDENGIKLEQHSIERQRKKVLDEFYKLFTECDFEQSHYHNNTSTIQHRHICEYHLNNCNDVERCMEDLFSKWDHVLSLFPSFSTLEQYDKRFNPRTKDGRIFYEKLYIYQAWFNLHSEINNLIYVLGRIMMCSRYHMWSHVTESSTSKLNDNLSRPTTPSSTSSYEQRESITESPSSSSPFRTTPKTMEKRLNTFTSMSSMDSIYQQSLASMSSLTDYYYRYIDDQVTHARTELIGSTIGFKHGPLLQRLRYAYRKEQGTNLSTFDDVLRSSPCIPTKIVPNDYLLDAKPDKLMDEFLTLTKQLQELKNPNLVNEKKRKSGDTYSDRTDDILNRFEPNSTLTSSAYTSVLTTTFDSKNSSHYRSIGQLRLYFLRYLDPTSYPHLPGSTLFPDPCTFLDYSSFNSSLQTPTEENILIAKILTISYRLYDKHVWIDSEKFSDMCDIFHLPSLYPQYVFLVQIPLDLMIAWQKYHQDKKMEQASTTGALLLLIDECKILIHNATLIRQYVKLMITDTLEKAELKLIEDELIQFDKNVIHTIDEIITYIESYIEMSLHSNLFHHCVMLLKEQWKSLRKYATMMNVEEILGEKFLNLYAKIIKHFSESINIFHSSTSPPEIIKIEHTKKKIRRKYHKKLTMTILREAKAIYDDCALTINIYLQRPICKRFLLILKTAGFERIKFASEYHHHHHENNQTDEDSSPSSKCLLFTPAEYFEKKSTKIQLIQTLFSSFRLNINSDSSKEPNDDQSSSSSQQQQTSVSSEQPLKSTSETSFPSVYILCVPIVAQLESEWRGVTHTIPKNKNLTSVLPLHTNWKTTTMFLLTQQTNNLEKFEESFRERLSKINIQQNDICGFETETRRLLQKRSCFEKIDNAMKNLAHSMLNLSNCIATDVENFEKMVEKLNTKDYVHTEERAFIFGMDVIRETSFYATQCDYDTFKIQAERQLSFANTWLNFVRKKHSTRTSRYVLTIPMWLLPGIHFLRHVCSLNFANHIDDDLFSKFYHNMTQTINYLSSSDKINNLNQGNIQLKTFQYSSITKHGYDKRKKRKLQLNRIEQLDRLDKRIDRKRVDEGLIGKIVHVHKTLSLPKRMEDDLAYLKIRNFHKLNLLSAGQYATTYKCSVNRDGKQEILCYKQYKIQYNNAQAIAKVLEQLMPLMHIDHANLIKYHGLALEHDHILFFMEYCSYGTIAQILLGTSLPLSSSLSANARRSSTPNTNTRSQTVSYINVRRQSSSNVRLIGDGSFIEKDIVETPDGFVFFRESLVKRYSSQLLSALSRLHEKEIIHRDIRNVNIFLTDSTKQSVKLGDVNFVYDFKFMKKQSSLLDMETVIKKRESVVFYAPETITQNETTIKSDIWSLGCAIIHMLTGHIPWTNRTTPSSAYYFRVLNWIADGIQPPIPTDLSLSNECIHFLEQCFQHDPSRRPSSHQLLEHPFLKEQ